MIGWYDRQGKRLPDDPREWEKKLSDLKYRRVAQATLSNGWEVSTVWMGLNHNFSDKGPPLIFETMVFPNEEDLLERYCERYATEADAQAGHERVVALLTLAVDGQATRFTRLVPMLPADGERHVRFAAEGGR